MKHVDDLKNASAAEFDEAEADWRETVQRMFERVAECDHVPTPEELDNLDFDPDLDLDHAIGAIQDHVAEVERAAHDWVADTQEWGKVAKARIEAKRKTEKA